MLARLLFIWVFLLSAQVLASAEGMYIHTDGLGSPVAKSDKNGNYISGSRTRYEPYGATAAGATPTIGFTGHVNDPDTGLIYMQQRYYDPYAGRFLSTDPVLTDANTGGSFNRYIYANNSPYNYIDPDGRFSEQACKDMAGNCSSSGSIGSRADWVKAGSALGFTGGVAVAGGCDGLTVGACVLANGPIVATGTFLGGAAGNAAYDLAKKLSGPSTSSNPPPEDKHDDKAKDKELSAQDQKSIRRYEQLIDEHKLKIQEFLNNPTVKPGMENQPQSVIEAQQAARVRHLQKEINTFQNNINKIRGVKGP